MKKLLISVLKGLWAFWKFLGLVLGTVVGTVVSWALYLVIITPFALPITLFGDILKARRTVRSTWVVRGPQDLSLEDLRKQYVK